jgi:hypothetical protein
MMISEIITKLSKERDQCLELVQEQQRTIDYLAGLFALHGDADIVEYQEGDKVGFIVVGVE